MRRLLYVAMLFLVTSCTHPTDYQQILHSGVLYSKITGQLTDVITYDIFTPPVASRIYAYSHLAAYEVMAHGDNNYVSLDGQLKGLKDVPKPDTSKPIDYPYASLMAFMNIGSTLTFSKDLTDKIIDSLKSLAISHGMPDEMRLNSEDYAMKVSNAVLAWSKKDSYAETRSAAKYTVPNEEGKWVPTPPGYIQAVEPQWRAIRTIAMDSCNQFAPPPPLKYGHDSTCDFYKMTKQVLDTGVNLTDE